jgi:hypothetical protein
MSASQWIFGAGGGLLLLAVVIFGFRQGFKTPPDDRPDRGQWGGGEGHS